MKRSIRKVLPVGPPEAVGEGKDILRVTSPLPGGGELRIGCEPELLGIEVTGQDAPADWGLELAWSPGKPTGISAIGPQRIDSQSQDFAYALNCKEGSIAKGPNDSNVIVRPAGRRIVFRFH